MINDTRFNICLPFTLIEEAPDPTNWTDPKNFSNDPRDPGGATYMGITQNAYDIWRKGQNLPIQNVQKITQDEGETIYYSGYWLPHCPQLLPGLDLCFFDSSVNQGPTQATRILQVAVRVVSDGEWGPITDAAVKAVKNAVVTIEAFTERREEVYRETSGFGNFGTDWERRAQEVGAAAVRASVIQRYALSMYEKYKLTGGL